MKNNLSNLNMVLFEQLERLQDDEALKDEEAFDKEIKRSQAVSTIATQLIESGKLSLRAAEFAAEYGKDVSVPLLGITGGGKRWISGENTRTKSTTSSCSIPRSTAWKRWPQSLKQDSELKRQRKR